MFSPTRILHYGIVEKFGEFGESSKLEPSKLVFTINNLVADLFSRQTVFRHMLEKS